MKKNIITVIAFVAGMSLGILINNNKKEEKILAETIDYIGDMKDWLVEDVGNNIIDDEYGEYYYSSLTDCEDNLKYLINEE